MNQKDENYISMVAATTVVLEANTIVWGVNTPVTNIFNSIKQNAVAISKAQKGGASGSTGSTLDKEVAGDAAIAQAVRLAGMVQVYALEQNNNTLHDQMRVSVTTLDRLADNALSPVLLKIYDTITDLGTAVEPYGVSADEVTILKNAIDTFDGIKSNPRVLIVERKSHNASIPTLMRELRTAFYKLDRLVKIWEKSNNKFVTDYQNARIVVDLGTRHNKPGEEGDKK